MALNLLSPFVWGAGGAALTPEEIARRREQEDALAARGIDTSPIASPLQGFARIADALSGSVRRHRLDAAAGVAQEKGSAIDKALGGALSGMFGGGAAANGTSSFPDALYTTGASGAGATTGGTASSDMTGNSIYSGFMGEIGKSVTNPNALAAIASTGKHESGFSPGNAFRQWSDPSQGGQAGNAGGILSWRAERLANLRKFAAANGGDPNRVSPELQGQFFLQENPALIASLNAAKSPEEAQRLMNNAWKFAGYDKAGGEAGARIATARALAGQFQGGAPVASASPLSRAASALALPDSAPTPYSASQPTQVASLDPRIGMGADQSALPDTGIVANTPQAANPDPRMAVDPQQTAGLFIGTPDELAGSRLPQTMQAPPGINPRIAENLAAPRLEMSGNADMPQQAQGGINPAIMQALSSPYASEGTKRLAGLLLQQQLAQQVQAADPLRQLQIKQAQKSLESPLKEWQRLDDHTLFSPSTGETKAADGGTGTSRFEGTGLDAQAWNILQNSDPSSREYATAYSIIAQPKPQMVQTENGMMLVPVAPQLPAWLTPPSGAPQQQSGQMPTGNPSMAAPTPGSPQQPSPMVTDGGQAGAGQLIPGTRKPMTEAQQRNQSLGTVLTNDLPTINKNFDALADPKGQLINAIPGGLGNAWQSEEYQRASNAVSASVSNILYSLSGASANPGEVQNQVRILTPAYGDKPGTIADKKARLNAYVQAVAGASGNPDLIAKAQKESIAGLSGDAPEPDKKKTVIDGYEIEEVQ